MKRIFFLILLGFAAVFGLSAQPLYPGSHWFNGRVMFEASLASDNIIQLKSINSNEDTQYLLTPIPGQVDWFTMDSNNDEEHDTTASLTADNGRAMLVFYKDGKVTAVFEQTDSSSDEIIAERWYPTVMGKFRCKTPEGDYLDVDTGREVITINGESAHYRMVTTNGYPLDVIEVLEGVKKGVWHFKRTLDGFNIYRAELIEGGLYEEAYKDIEEVPYVLTWDDPTKSRWSYLSEVFIIPIHYQKSTLRMIRNHILAQHGYVFKDKALKKYFSAQPWYKPVKNNDEVHLNFIEQMNIARIQGEEAKPDEARVRVTEEEPGVPRK